MRMNLRYLVHGVIAVLLSAGIGTAEVVRMEHGHLEVSVGDAPEGNGFVYKIAGAKFSDATLAAKGLEYLYAHWPEKRLPTLEYACNTKRRDAGIDEFEAVVEKIAKRKDVIVIFRPPARGAIPESWFTVEKLLKQMAVNK
jgi:hypothetical protein